MEREQLIQQLSGGRGYSALTQEQRNRVNAANIVGKAAIDTQGQLIGRVSPESVAPRPTSEVGILSSQKGADLIRQAQQTEARLTPQLPQSQTSQQGSQQTTTVTTPQNPPAPQDKKTPAQGLTFMEAAELFGKDFTGVKQQTDGTYTPDESALGRLGVKTAAQTPEQVDAEKKRQAAVAARAHLTNFAQEVSNDPALLSLLEGVSRDWDVRIREQEQANVARAASVKTAGIRLGARYTGGLDPKDSMFGGIISAEERAGLQRIDDLLSRKKTSLIEARTAFESKQWDRYAKLVDLADEDYTEAKKAIVDLNTTNKEQINKIAEQKRLLESEKLVFDAFSFGAKDKKDLYTALRGVVDTKTIDDVWDRIYDEEEDPLIKTRLEVLKSAVGNDAPPEVVDAIRSAATGEEAVVAAGTYLTAEKPETTPGGIVGEYLFYKKDAEARGITPLSFDAYQNVDVNRRKSIAQAGVANSQGLTPAQTTTFLRISDKFQADSVIKTASQGASAIAIADQVIANPGSATNQLMILYTLVKSLDPDSAVREGELDLASKTQSYLGKYGASLERIGKGKLISSSAATELANATKVLAKQWYESGKRREKQYQAQAKTANVGSAFSNYLGDSDLIYREESPVIKEQEAKQKLIDYGKDNPDAQEQIRQMLKEYNPVDAAQILGII
jgi:hypothetical protein